MLSRVLLTVTALLALPAAASADTAFVSGDASDLITADAQGLVYAAPGRSAVRLRQGFGAGARNLPVAGERPGSNGFWGVNLGTDSKGGRALAYSRCKRDRCDLYVYGFGARKQRKLKSISRSTCLERNPSLVRGTVVFVREARKSRTRRLRCTGGIFRKRPGSKLERIAREQPFGLDFDGTQVAYTVRKGSKSQIRVFRPGRRSKLLAEGVGDSDRGGNNGTFLDRPTLAAGQVYWVRTVSSGMDDTVDVVRRPAGASGPAQVLDRSGRLWVDSTGLGSDSAVGGVAVGGASLYYAYANSRTGLVSGPPVFR